MKKNVFRHLISLSLVFAMAISVSATSKKTTDVPGDPSVIPAGLQIDWNHRYTFAELEQQLSNMAKEYPQIAQLYSIGTSWQERDLWCLEITGSGNKNQKTGIGIFANIHGGERESASSAMYTAWWFLLNSDTSYVKDILKNYVLYVIPVINPDGYEQSFVINNRTNLHPRDLNGNGIPFSDPYTDINGDGYISTLYRGIATATPSTKLPQFGMESPDWDINGILGDDPRSSSIDLNRTFDYQWNRYDIETYKTGGADVIGSNSWASAGPSAASEPEVRALQDFMYNTPMYALTTLHTGIQCVLYPWCYRPYDSGNPKDADIPFMKDTAAQMAAAFQETTGRGFYTKSSYDDYPTSAEMIDYAYGRLGIHAYTIEVYSGGKSGNINDCKWGNELPAPTWTFYSQEALKGMGLNPDKITDAKGEKLKADEGLWFYTSSTNQMVDKAPEDQATMVKGALNSILVMIKSEPNGDGAQVPHYVK